jgi:hypothetical protein
MKALFELYGLPYPMKRSGVPPMTGKAAIAAALEIEMLMVTIMSLLCAGGIAFCACFLLALCRDCGPHIVGHWARLRIAVQEQPSGEANEDRRGLVRAA